MTCPNCGAIFDGSCRFCGACGTPLTIEKKGTHRVPILIMLALAIVGLCVYFATGSGGTVQTEAPTFDPSWFSVSNGNLKFQKYEYNGSGVLSVPSQIDGQRIVWIDDGCFADCDVLTEVFLPDTVQHIGLSAFADCDQLIAIDLPPELNTVGAGAFADCDNLEAIHVPATVNLIGRDAFADCDNLLYIFFDGTWEKWNQVYSQELGPNTFVCCSDGNHSQVD